LPIVVVIVFWPTIYAFGWHLRYGAESSFKGKVVPIPLGWTVLSADESKLTLIRQPRSIFSRGPYEFITFQTTVARTSSSEAFSNWQRSMAFLYKVPEYEVIGPERVDDSAQSFCITIFSARWKRAGQMSCWLENGAWQAEFLGKRADMAQFRTLIRAFR